LIDNTIHKIAQVINGQVGEISTNYIFPALLCTVNKVIQVFQKEQFNSLIPALSCSGIGEPWMIQQLRIMGGN
jgi:hypothetical protein